jgi:hypothetical protein
LNVEKLVSGSIEQKLEASNYFAAAAGVQMLVLDRLIRDKVGSGVDGEMNKKVKKLSYQTNFFKELYLLVVCMTSLTRSCIPLSSLKSFIAFPIPKPAL